ncbi:biopolymer transporter ExbD [Methylocella sp.]|uniref:biopolymer transporter ExbD n=1 Tax=Methylocella sp. TaxID=1978226 RepID=UPI0035B41F21
MAMATMASRKSGRGRRGAPRARPLVDRNKTPVIDVMGVLRHIVMVAAPLLATGVPIDLPQTKAAALNIEQKPLSVAVDDKGAIFVMDEPVEAGKLADKLREIAKAGADERIYVRGANQVNYGKIAEVMSIITGAGFKKVALVTDPSKS